VTLRIVGYHITPQDEITIANSDGEFIKGKERILYWLLTSKPGTIRIFYNVDYAVAQILKALNLTKEQGQILSDTNTLWYPPYELHYVTNKYFNIQKGQGKGSFFVNYSDASQYFDWTLSENDDAQEKADKAREMGEQVYDGLSSIGLHPTALTSPIRCYEKEVLSKMNLPNVVDLPTPVAKHAYQCESGMWVEAFMMGSFEDAYDFDIKSAFGFKTSKLINPNLGTWTRTKSYQEGAYYGFANCKIEIDTDFSPILVKKGDHSYGVVGVFERFLPKSKIDYIKRHKIGEVEVLDGVWFSPDKIEYPFERICNELYEKKEASTGMTKEVIKLILAQIWGKTLSIETKGEEESMGDLFNPVFGVSVESDSHIQVADYCVELMKQGFEIGHIAIDGVTAIGSVSSSTVPPFLSIGSAMGDWKLSSHSPAIIAGSGSVAIKDKIGINELSLNYDWLMGNIVNKPNETEYVLTKTTPMTLGKALIGENWSRLGALIQTRRIVNGHEIKREYDSYPEVGSDFLKQYRSSPRDISQIGLVDDFKSEITEDDIDYE